jgi:hypothetical protein
MKSAKVPKQWHTSNSKSGIGTYTGTGIKNPVGKIRDVFGSGPINLAKKGKPPKSLA